LNVDVFFGRPVETKPVNDIMTFRIFMMIRNHKALSTFTSGIITVVKDVQRDLIKKVSLSRGYRNDKTKAECLENYKRGVAILNQSSNSFDAIITSDKYLFSDNKTITRDIYNLKPVDEDRIIRLYIENSNKVYSHKTLKIQTLDLGNGLILTDTSEKSRLKIDLEEIKPHTIALMFAMDYVVNNEAYKLIQLIKKGV